jgi:hypothetical protein
MGNKINSGYHKIFSETSLNINSGNSRSTIDISLGEGNNKIILRSMDDIIHLFNKSTNLNILLQYVNDPNSHIPEWYDLEILLNWYETHLDLLCSEDEKSEILAKLMPKNDRNFIWPLYRNMVPIKILKIIAPNIKFRKHFLFQVPNNRSWKEIISYIISLIEHIEHIDNIPIHNISKSGDAFLSTLSVKNNFWHDNLNSIQKLFKILSDHGFNFKRSNQSLLSYLVTRHPDYIFNYRLLVAPESYDISKDCEWLQTLFRDYSDNIVHNYVWQLLQRKDYEKFLYNSYKNINYIWSVEYLKFIMKCNTMNHKKTLDMLHYTDNAGNTVIHYIAQRHDKLLLHHIITLFSKPII